MDWCSEPDELEKLYNEMLTRDIGVDISSEVDNNLNIDESEATVLLSLHLDLLNRNLDKNGKTRPQTSDVGDLDIGSLQISETRPTRPTTLFANSKEKDAEEHKDVDEGLTENGPRPPEWGPAGLGLWHSGPSSLAFGHNTNNNMDSSSVISFSSSVCSGGVAAAPLRTYSQQQLGAKVEMVYNLLSMLGTTDREDMSKTLLAMSSTAESCQAMRQSGCVPLLIQLMHSQEVDMAVRVRAQKALNNVVSAQTDEKRKRRETRILKLLNTVREHCDALKTDPSKVSSETHPSAAVAAIMKFSFDAEHRQAMCTLGGLHAIAELIQVEHEAHGSATSDTLCVTLRRYAGMALTNLTFGDGANKALLCSFTSFMEALVAQLNSPSEDLRQVTSSVIRNLSWRADGSSKTSLREVGAVTALMTAAMEAKKEATLKSILSALWNLSAHCSMNKVDICSVQGALAFLVRTLRYKATSATLGIIENAGGILRNVSSHVAVRDDYRQILRDAGCFEILLEQLKSPSLTVVSNACGTLWNLSARCPEDQRRLWDMGATSMLRSLIHSKHKMIAMGSSAALKNLLAANPNGNMMAHVDSTARSMGLQNMPTLSVRKKRALEQQLDATLAEACDGMENLPKRSESKESVTSTQSDSVYERIARGNKVLDDKDATLHDSLSETSSTRKLEEAKLLRRYRTSGIPKPASRQSEQPKQPKPEPTKRGIPVLKARLRPRAVSAGPSPRFTQFPCELEEEPAECPVNYSLQYSESDDPTKAQDESYSSFKKEEAVIAPPTSSPAPPSLYAETDLDQPTNFSLKYGEETSSDEGSNNQGYEYYDSNKLDTEDTTRTYFTEGTPYEGTPYTFSGATSMSDLRIDPCEADPKQDEKLKESPLSLPSGITTPGKPEPRRVAPRLMPAKNGAESGLESPERPVHYCEEGTPGDCISRVSSLSSLAEKDSTKISPGKKEKEGGKVVTFNENVSSVNETPLMFSRSSSLTSLNSLAPPLPDGASSVVSTISRVTSGAVSPSELPDSPTQTVPPSPRSSRAPEPNVFDDAFQSFKLEGTPMEFSCRTSLSGLSFEQTGSTCSSNCEEAKGDQTVPERGDRLELTRVSEGDEEGDDDILADCINIGMQDTRNRPRMPNKTVSELRSVKPRLFDIPTSFNGSKVPAKPPTVYEDSVQTYHTEDTPANISHAGSHNDLSNLSSLGINDSANSSDTENILNECIHSGMPQAKTQHESGYKKPVKSMGIGSSRKNAVNKPQVQPDLPRPACTVGAPSYARDEVSTFETENSPCVFSIRSSLSDLTINTDSTGPHLLRAEVTSSPIVVSAANGASPSSISLTGSEEGCKALDNTRDESFVSIESTDVSEDVVTALSHQTGLSLSVESLDSCEPTPQEQALLEQCIHSGMPRRTKNAVAAPAAGMGADGAGAGTVKDDVEAMIGSQTSVGNHTWSDDVSLSVSACVSGEAEEGLVVVDGPRPVFRVGAGVTPSLAQDTARICREIQKLQEQDGRFGVSSLSSELSLISTDSFLDAELSGLELPDRPTPDFLASEEHPVTLKLLKLGNEPLSMSSLTRPDCEVDLENSMISVASITSEIADGSTLAAESDTEVPDDEDFSCHEELPLDVVNISPKVHRRLTPKEKRRISNERYRTYTVDELKQKCCEETSGEVNPAPAKLTPKQRRLNDRDRFLTRTISLEEEQTVLPERRFDTYRVRKDNRRTPVSNIPRIPKGRSGEMTTAERLELVANATLIAQCLNAEDRSIDTNTYVAHQPDVKGHSSESGGTDTICDVGSESEREEDLADDLDDDLQTKGPRITVPDSQEAQIEPKGIRGRRKPLYRTPAGQRVTKSSPPSPKIVGKEVKTNLIKNPNLVREGTFTKDETAPNTRQSRLPELRASRVGIPRPASVPNAARSSTANRAKPANAAHKRNNSAGSSTQSSQIQSNFKRQTSAGPGIKTSLSNHSIKSVGSTSSVSTNRSAAASPEKSGTKNPKKEVTSKIANLWKKVEETKKRSKTGGKDSRVWITNAKSAEDEVIVIEQEEVLDITSGKIVKSSTFQGKSSHDTRGKPVRNSGDFSSWERGASRNVVAAVVAPYNYSPPQAKLQNTKPQPAPPYPSKVTTV